MKRMRILGLALVAVFALVAITAGAASAKPQWKACVKTEPKNTGNFSDKLCSVGAPGTGKSTVAVQFAIAAARRGECAALFCFDESINTLRTRCTGMGMELRPYIDDGSIRIRQVDPAELSPGELVHEIREAVTNHGATVVIIDSLNGYLNAMPDERFLIVQLHELLTYLGQAGVATMLIGAQHGLIGMQMQTPVDASYLADSVVLLRYFEVEGEVRQAISVLKKRGGAHERSIRAFSLGSDGVRVGPPLRNFRGILSGIPVPIDGVRAET